ncbi:MAG: DUF790 family protein [SAR324 cluster bacterium]|nr:DUF790 family protein [SAR324 cluster bacterium]
MLTGNRLVFRRRGDRVRPVLLDPAHEAVRAAAEALLALFNAHQGRPRGELEEALKAVSPPGLNPKQVSGLAKLLMDQSEFDIAGQGDPRRLRAELFDRAAQCWREQGSDGLDQWRDDILRAVAGDHGLQAESVERAMFGDLRDNQVLLETPRQNPQQLIFRYNVAQAQGLLLTAERLDIRAPWPEPLRLRSLLRYLKFFGLLFQASGGSHGEDLHVRVDGPLSVLESSTRYGLQLASFLPALLLWPPPWQAEADLRPRRGGKMAHLVLEPHRLLQSHYPDRGGWVPDAVARFVEGFNKQKTDWRAAAADLVFTLPGNRCLVPDFTLTCAQGGRTVHLEHVNYPSDSAVRRKLDLVADLPHHEYWIACRALPSLGADLVDSSRLFTYRRNLVPGQVRERLESGKG